MADRDAPLQPGGDRARGDVTKLGRAGLAAVMQMNVDPLAEPLGETEHDVELTLDVLVEACRVQPAHQIGAGVSAAAIRSGAPFSVITPLCGKATS